MSTANDPTVSVILCTRDRPTLFRRALASVVRAARTLDQPFEIIVIADGAGPVDVAVDGDERVRLIGGPHAGVGAARFTALNAVRGEFVAYCDDDDEWTSDHLTLLVGYLRQHPEVALVHGNATWLSDESGLLAPAPERVPELGFVDRLHASSVVHRAEAARDVGGFDPSLRAYEDIDLWCRMDEAHLLAHVPADVARHRRHLGNVTATIHSDERDRVLRYHSHRRHGRDQFFTSVAPSSDRHLDPATWQPPRRELLWRSPLNPYQGFGIAARQLLLAVERAGVDVALAMPPGPAAPEFQRFATRSKWRGRIGFSFEYWHSSNQVPDGLQVVATMREGTLVPKARINALNQAAALVYVPCRQNLESFRACGLQVPSKVLAFGVDPTQFPRLERPRRGDEPFTFGTFGTLSPRKGIDVLIRAFRAEFRPGEPVRLLLKGVDAPPLSIPKDANIEVLTGFWRHNQLLSFLQRLDAFVLPSRAEGFGLCGLEAMATGLPVIATGWSGPADYLDPADSFPLSYRLTDAAATEANGVRYFGAWAEPAEDHLRQLLRWLYEHPGEARAMGRRASARVHADWTWDRASQQLVDDLDLLARGLSPA